jgi:hypothetical protein
VRVVTRSGFLSQAYVARPLLACLLAVVGPLLIGVAGFLVTLAGLVYALWLVGRAPWPTGKRWLAGLSVCVAVPAVAVGVWILAITFGGSGD